MASDRKIIPSSDSDNEIVHSRLRKYNRLYMTDIRDRSFHIEEDGVIIAGIVAAATFDTLEVEFLFVEEAYRGQGLGRRLLQHAEELALRDGVKRILLNTYSFQAPEFYEKLGFTRLLAIDPCFGEYSQYFYIKRLTPQP